MNKLRIQSFKAFESEIVLPLNDNKNLLLYGENGAGKSSIYEALKVAFFREQLESKITAATPEDLEQLKNEFWGEFNNKISNQNFSIEVNDIDHKVFDILPYQVFMISIEELVIDSTFNLKQIISRSCFPISDIPQFCANHEEQIEQILNSTLLLFNESISVEIDEEDDFNIKITDSRKGIARKSDLRKYFNEAKLNLILLLLLLSVAHISKEEDKSKILVLDDFITSLDASNRTFLTKHIIEKFQDTQILIFTHNISFYNLVMYVVNDFDGGITRWQFANVFELNNIHKLYVRSELERTQDIKNDFQQLGDAASPLDIESMGNRVRKKFEVLLYEYSKLLMIGSVEDSKKILERLTNGKPAYFNNNKTASDLIDSIEIILNENNPHNLINRLKAQIATYKIDDFVNLQKIVKELKLYQKVSMHPLSHGVAGMPTFTIKEIKQSISLLEKMEGYFKEMVNKNVAEV